MMPLVLYFGCVHVDRINEDGKKAIVSLLNKSIEVEYAYLQLSEAYWPVGQHPVNYLRIASPVNGISDTRSTCSAIFTISSPASSAELPPCLKQVCY